MFETIFCYFIGLLVTAFIIPDHCILDFAIYTICYVLLQIIFRIILHIYDHVINVSD